MRNSRREMPRAPVCNVAGMAKRKTSGPYRCEATMRDGSAGVLFASCSTPSLALDMVRRTWLGQGDEPIEIRVYRGGRTKPIGPPLATWRS
jgi:hypothetical protein